jgi:hypothetical protein
VRLDLGTAGLVVGGIQLVDFRGAALTEEVGQAGARGVVEAAPVFARADQFGGRDAGQALAGLVPDDDPALGIDHEGRHDQVFHQADGEVQLAKCLIVVEGNLPCRHGNAPSA